MCPKGREAHAGRMGANNICVDSGVLRIGRQHLTHLDQGFHLSAGQARRLVTPTPDYRMDHHSDDFACVPGPQSAIAASRHLVGLLDSSMASARSTKTPATHTECCGPEISPALHLAGDAPLCAPLLADSVPYWTAASPLHSPTPIPLSFSISTPGSFRHHLVSATRRARGRCPLARNSGGAW